MKADIQFVKETHRFPYRFTDFLNGLFLILPICVFGLSILMIYSYNLNNMTGLNELLLVALIGGLIGITSTILIIRRLVQNIQFVSVTTGLDLNSNVSLIKNVFLKLYDRQSIDMKNIHDGLIIANSAISMLSWGEVNTAICEENVIFINSRPVKQPVTIYENRLNIKRIIKNIKIENSKVQSFKS